MTLSQFPISPADIILSRLPAVALGFNIYQGLQHMGRDPKCMVSAKKMTVSQQKQILLVANLHSVKMGWENEVKWRFFCPLLGVASLGVVLMLIVLCNLATPAIRCL